ncbi:MAG: OmpH family outer membrane protein [Prevotellaceae bacterium]|jgi:outer membrane protein|nr:OmpH family outer membrane protein [Prevotellaceae bacterium]
MKKFYLCILVAISLAACNSPEKQSSPTEDNISSETSPEKFVIAVVNVDSIHRNYTFAKNINELLHQQQEDARLNLNSKARQLQKDMEDFQNKLDNNAFLSRERAEKEGLRLQRKQADLQELEQKLSSDLMERQEQLIKQLNDSITNVVTLINADRKYTLVITTSYVNNNVLYVEERFDITDTVLKQLNSRIR